LRARTQKLFFVCGEHYCLILFLANFSGRNFANIIKFL
jgi:hypothetical protein